MIKWLKQRFCHHVCFLENMVLNDDDSADDRITCACNKCGKVLSAYYGLALHCDWERRPRPRAMQPKKSPFEKYAAGEKLTHEEILALGSPEEAYALGLSRSAYLSTAEVSEEDKELLKLCEKLLERMKTARGLLFKPVIANWGMLDTALDEKKFIALKRRIEGEVGHDA